MEPIRYMTSLLTFYLKGEIRSEQNTITFKEPNTILGLIPLGTHESSFRVSQIASVGTNFRLRFPHMILGILLIVASILVFRSPFSVHAAVSTFSVILGIILLLLGFGAIIDAFEIDLIVRNNSGEQKTIDFLIFDKAKAELAAKQIRTMASNRDSDTNVRENGERQTDRIVEALRYGSNRGQADFSEFDANTSAAPFCPACGSRLGAGAMFCSHCGSNVQ